MMKLLAYCLIVALLSGGLPTVSASGSPPSNGGLWCSLGASIQGTPLYCPPTGGSGGGSPPPSPSPSPSPSLNLPDLTAPQRPQQCPPDCPPPPAPPRDLPKFPATPSALDWRLETLPNNSSTGHDVDGDGIPDLLDAVNLPSESRTLANNSDALSLSDGLDANGLVLLVEPSQQQAYLLLSADTGSSLFGPETGLLTGSQALDEIEATQGLEARNALAMLLTEGMEVHRTLLASDVPISLPLTWTGSVAADGSWLLIHTDPTRLVSLTLAGKLINLDARASSHVTGASITQYRWQFLNVHTGRNFCYDATTSFNVTDCPGNQWPGWIRAYSGQAANTLEGIEAGLRLGALPVAIGHCSTGARQPLQGAPCVERTCIEPVAACLSDGAWTLPCHNYAAGYIEAHHPGQPPWYEACRSILPAVQILGDYLLGTSASPPATPDNDCPGTQSGIVPAGQSACTQLPVGICSAGSFGVRLQGTPICAASPLHNCPHGQSGVLVLGQAVCITIPQPPVVGPPQTRTPLCPCGQLCS